MGYFIFRRIYDAEKPLLPCLTVGKDDRTSANVVGRGCTAMLKNCGYGGTYHDKDISVSMLLENPLDCGLEAASLVFSVIIRDKRTGSAKLSPEDFTFYIVDEANFIYNTQKTFGQYPQIQELPGDDESVREPDCLIFTEFRPEFLFQNMRIAFYDRHHRQLHIIELRH